VESTSDSKRIIGFYALIKFYLPIFLLKKKKTNELKNNFN